ncbi:MAG: alpha-hydroxy acid oxidase [Paracoccus sp. (in: a-proteobacteria)]|nr:alpha-hydroxy acid oxidase [Paracoccus sp. (in: a-proteobacteria)]
MSVTKKPPRRLRKILSLDDFEPAARRHLPRPVFGYISGSTETGAAAQGSRAAADALHLVPRILTGHAQRDQSVTLFGRRYAHPFGIAPMGLSALAAYDGDVVLARAARDIGIPAVMSSTSLTMLERVAEEAGSTWFQAYFLGDNDHIDRMMDRIEAAGYDHLVVTADVPVPANRENNIRNGFEMPLRPGARLAWQGVSHPRWLLGTAWRTLRTRGMPHFESMAPDRGPPILSRHVARSIGGRETLSWAHIERVRARFKGRLIIKGVLAADDAATARDLGCDGVIVSNHGGRQLDYALPALEALPEIVDVAGEMEVMCDSGFRRGTDVLKAIALGARFVFVGRPFLYAAAIAGEAGVQHGARLLSAEIDRNMAMLGTQRLDQIGPQHLRRAGPHPR